LRNGQEVVSFWRSTELLRRSTIVDILTYVDMSADPVNCCGPLAAPSLTDGEAAATADVFRALADPARVRIVNVLATSGEAVCVCHLVEPLGLTQPTVSHHLKRLTDAGLLDREQRGRWAYYSLRPEAAERLAAVVDLKGACC
jgi:ArsR family transcriptional regulator